MWRANSLPMPDDAPVMTAHGPNLRLSICPRISVSRGKRRQAARRDRFSAPRTNDSTVRKARDWYQIETWCKLRTKFKPSFLEVTAAMSSSEKRGRDDRVLLDLLADKWTIHVLGSLCDHGYRRRFNAIPRDVPGLFQKSLVQCLRRLEKSGLVEIGRAHV